MTKNYSEEFKELINKYKNKGFRYAKPLDFILERIDDTKENVEKELNNIPQTLKGVVSIAFQNRSYKEQ